MPEPVTMPAAPSVPERVPGGRRVRSVPRAAAVSILALMVLSGGGAIAATAMRAHPTLPATSPEQLIAAVLRAAAPGGSPVSGSVETHVDLGLPTFPIEGGPASTGATGLAALLGELTGDHRVRLWSSTDGYRADELLPTAERAIYVSRQGGWLWSSDAYTAYELFDAKAAAALGRAEAAQEAERSTLMQLADPLTLARGALAAASPTTSVSMGSPVRVAGRAAYVLVLTPKDTTTLVGRVELAVDAATHVPLSAAVFAKGAASPAISARFTSVSYRPIPASVYRFVPPPGAKVKELYQQGNPGGPVQRAPGFGGGSVPSVRAFGTGWSTILAVDVPPSQLSNAGSADGVDLRRFLPFSGPLFSLRLVTTPGHRWLVAGAVPQSALAAVEPQLP